MASTSHHQQIGIMAAGTRGDVQPAITLGKGLQDAGYQVTIIAGTNFEEWVTSHDLLFADLGMDVHALMTGDTGRAWAESSPFTQFFHMRRMVDKVTDQTVEHLTDLLPQFDALITGMMTFPLAMIVSRTADIPLFHLTFQPLYSTRSGVANLVAIRPQAYSWVNLLTRPMMVMGLWYVYRQQIKRACQIFDVPSVSIREFDAALQETPTFIAVSPQVVPPADDYPAHVHVSGYLFLDEHPDWTPPPELAHFLDAGEPPLYIGFGSMTGHNNDGMLQVLIEALDGRRAIINRGWSDMAADALPESVHLLDGAPHEWLFPRVRALVHHGGAGTTAAGLRAGKPALIVPHLADQFYYGRRIHELSAGPEPIPRQDLNATRLRDALTTLLSDEAYAAHAATLAAHIQDENGQQTLVNLLETYLRHDTKD